MPDLPALPVLVLLSALTAGVGTLGGIGGAILLVPLLVLLGVDPAWAPPLGILSVAAGSLAAGPRQISSGVVHQRLGVTLEITASAGAIVGALIGEALNATTLARLLGVTAIIAALAGARRKGMRNLPRAEFVTEAAGEWPGTLGGTYRLGDEVVPYHARRVPVGIVAMIGAGLLSGLSGVGGGFIKTPVMSEVMHVPVKVAAATSTFTVGFTSAAALLVYAGQGRITYRGGAAIVVGGLIGGLIGARLQQVLHPRYVRVAITAVLLVVGLTVLVRA